VLSLFIGRILLTIQSLENKRTPLYKTVLKGPGTLAHELPLFSSVRLIRAEKNSTKIKGGINAEKVETGP
jgi:hypothetical protein